MMCLICTYITWILKENEAATLSERDWFQLLGTDKAWTRIVGCGGSFGCTFCRPQTFWLPNLCREVLAVLVNELRLSLAKALSQSYFCYLLSFTWYSSMCHVIRLHVLQTTNILIARPLLWIRQSAWKWVSSDFCCRFPDIESVWTTV